MLCNPIRILALALALTAAFNGNLLAQERAAPFFGGGAAFGIGDLGQDSSTGWSVFGGIDLPTRVPGLSVGTTLSHARIPYEGRFNEMENVTAVVGEVAYLLRTESTVPVKPYFRGGLGLLVYRYDPGDINANSSTLSRPGVTADAGLTFRMGGIWAFLGGRFMGEVDRGYLGVHAGLAFR